MAQGLPNQPKFLPRIERNASGAGNSYVATASGNPFETDEEDEIFSRHKMVLRVPSNCTGDLMHLAVSRNWLFCLMGTPERTTLLRFFLPRAIPPGGKWACHLLLQLFLLFALSFQRPPWKSILRARATR